MSSSKDSEKDLKDGENVVVCVRVRPLNDREKNSGQREVWKWGNGVISQAKSGGFLFGVNNQKQSVRTSSYNFDHIFGPDMATFDLYETVCRGVVTSALSGVHGTVFAYGQTSSGKTHTMQGTDVCRGVIPFAMDELFDFISEDESRRYLLRVSMVEIYNEIINDLLDPSKTNLKLQEDPEKGGIIVGDLTEEVVNTTGKALEILQRGAANRQVGATNMNEASSRSHTIFRMVIESEGSDGGVRVSHLNLVDLAGSERTSQTGAAGARLKEGAHINKSLLTLGTVIRTLATEGSAGHIPYRNSKLTRMLQASLGGNARTAIICTVTPAAMHSEETHSTLRFGSQAKKIKNKAVVNETLDDKVLIKQYEKEIERLRSELSSTNLNAPVSPVQSAGGAEKEKELQSLRSETSSLKEKIKHLTEMFLGGDQPSMRDPRAPSSAIQHRRSVSHQGPSPLKELRRRSIELNSALGTTNMAMLRGRSNTAVDLGHIPAWLDQKMTPTKSESGSLGKVAEEDSGEQDSIKSSLRNEIKRRVSLEIKNGMLEAELNELKAQAETPGTGDSTPQNRQASGSTVEELTRLREETERMERDNASLFARIEQEKNARREIQEEKAEIEAEMASMKEYVAELESRVGIEDSVKAVKDGLAAMSTMKYLDLASLPSISPEAIATLNLALSQLDM